MHPESELLTGFTGEAAWWTREYVRARRVKRLRRTVGNVVAFTLTLASFTGLWGLVNAVSG